MPAWVGGGSYWSLDSQTYLIKWLKCVRQACNGTTIEYLSLWYEPKCRSDVMASTKHTIAMRSLMDSSGFKSTKLVAFDDAPQYPTPSSLPADFHKSMATNEKLRKALPMVGFHYCCTDFLAPTPSATSRKSTPKSKSVNRRRTATCDNRHWLRTSSTRSRQRLCRGALSGRRITLTRSIAAAESSLPSSRGLGIT